MAVNPVVTSAATTNTQMDNASLNPDALMAPANVARDKRIVHITLEIEGNVSVTPDDIYDALDAEFAVVASPKSTMARGCWIFNIGPS